MLPARPASVAAVQQAVEQSQHRSEPRSAARVACVVLGQHEPRQRQVLVLAQVDRVVLDGDAAVVRPFRRRDRAPPTSSSRALGRGDGADLRIEATPVQRLRAVEQPGRRSEITLGCPQLGRDHEPAVPVLRDGGPLGQRSRRVEVRLGARSVVELTVELGEPDVQVGRGPGVGRAASGRGPQGLLVQAAGAPGPAGCHPHVGEHHRAVQLVDQVPGGVQAADGLSEHRQRLPGVPRRPGRQAEEPAPAPRTRWSSGPARSRARLAWRTVPSTSPRAWASDAR